MNTSSTKHVTVILPRERVTDFSSLLQHGILYAVDKPVHISSFLLALPGFSAEYLAKNVQTVFINGSAADSLDRFLGPGGTLALSAAMPGLAGAIFRRQGLHSTLRSRTVDTVHSGNSEPGFITLKLFNSIASERVPQLMAQGILIDSKAFLDFAGRREKLFQPPVQLVFAGKPLPYAEMFETLQQTPLVKIDVRYSPDASGAGEVV